MIYDLFIIGGGVNGCAIARDATGRGLTVFLAEQNDLAAGTSSASTKLIHGGLRYLEHYEFRLVREALIEREVLMNSAPHIIWPLRFILPHHTGLRPRWLIRLGLFMYDHLGGRKILPPTRSVDFRKDITGQALKDEFTSGFEYSDCWVEDARLVVLMARHAAAQGAMIRTRTKVTSARRDGAGWLVDILASDGTTQTISAKVLVNASGPWVSDVLAKVVGRNDPDKIRMVKGSHLVVDKLYDHDRCYIFQNADGRICFAIPYETNFTLIGTTDEDYHGEPSKPEISQAETDYLLAAVSEYFKRPVKRDMVRWAYSGIRPLYDDGASSAQEATRDYVLKVEQPEGQPPMLSIFGGKITTSRKLAEHALEKLQPFFPKFKAPWTAGASLPGGMAYAQVAQYIADQQKAYSFLKPQNVLRLFRAYGTDMQQILNGARFASDLGKSFGPLSEREVEYLRKHEWAITADDILWRRSKLGLHLKADEIQELREYMGEGMIAEKSKKRK
jgi:glycerol-3-phosphate dehydrogenase